MLKFKLICLAFLCAGLNGYCANRFTIFWNNWYNGTGVITHADLKVTPNITYTEYELILDLNTGEISNGTNIYNFELLFELPAHSYITRAWYLRNEEFMEAELRNRIGVFSEKTDRSKSFFKLTKEDSINYRLVLDPVVYRRSRAIKLHYYSPTKYVNNELAVCIPYWILNTSRQALENISLRIVPNDFCRLSTQSISEFDFKEVSDSLGIGYVAEIANHQFNTENIRLKTNADNMLHLSTFNEGSDQYYKVMFKPAELIQDTIESGKTCFLIDYIPGYTNISPQVFIQQIKAVFKDSYYLKDSFNVIYSGMLSNSIFNEWMPVTSENIDLAFDAKHLNMISNLGVDIPKSLAFIGENNQNARLLILSNYPKHFTDNDSFIEDVLMQNVYQTKISVIDFTANIYYVNSSNKSQINSSTLFMRLCEESGGNYYRLFKDHSHQVDMPHEILKCLNIEMGTNLSELEIISDERDSKTYSRFNIITGDELTSGKNTLVYQIGKFESATPLNFTTQFYFNQTPYQFNFSFESQSIHENDQELPLIWNGRNLEYMEVKHKYEYWVKKIIEKSLEQSILGKYTAFMNSDVPETVCIECTQLNYTSNVLAKFKLAPNPYTEGVLHIMPALSYDPLISLEIFDLQGNCVKDFYVEQDMNDYYWDGICDNGNLARPGIYILIGKYTNRVETKKFCKY